MAYLQCGIKRDKSGEFRVTTYDISRPKRRHKVSINYFETLEEAKHFKILQEEKRL